MAGDLAGLAWFFHAIDERASRDRRAGWARLADRRPSPTQIEETRMCSTHDHEHAHGREHGHSGHCNQEDRANVTLDELKLRRDRLDREIAALELDRADAARL